MARLGFAPGLAIAGWLPLLHLQLVACWRRSLLNLWIWDESGRYVVERPHGMQDHRDDVLIA